MDGYQHAAQLISSAFYITLEDDDKYTDDSNDNGESDDNNDIPCLHQWTTNGISTLSSLSSSSSSSSSNLLLSHPPIILPSRNDNNKIYKHNFIEWKFDVFIHSIYSIPALYVSVEWRTIYNNLDYTYNNNDDDDDADYDYNDVINNNDNCENNDTPIINLFDNEDEERPLSRKEIVNEISSLSSAPYNHNYNHYPHDDDNNNKSTSFYQTNNNVEMIERNLSEEEHPITGLPSFLLHPCNTLQFMNDTMTTTTPAAAATATTTPVTVIANESAKNDILTLSKMTSNNQSLEDSSSPPLPPLAGWLSAAIQPFGFRISPIMFRKMMSSSQSSR